VTQRADRVWVAKLLTWADFSVEGNSREDALLKLDQQVKAQLADGEIAYLDLPLVQAKNPSPKIDFVTLFSSVVDNGNSTICSILSLYNPCQNTSRSYSLPG
jgi:hypothetical protein